MRVAVVKKKPSEKFAIGLRYSSTDLAEGAKIASVTTSISPSGNADDLVVSGTPVVVDDMQVGAVVEKGRDGLEYYVTFNVVTSTGQKFQDKIFVKVRS